MFWRALGIEDELRSIMVKIMLLPRKQRLHSPYKLGVDFFTPRSKMSKIQTYFETFPQEEKEICRNGNFTQLENKKDLRLMPRVSRLLPLPCHRYIHTWYYRCVPLFHGYRIKKKVYQHKILWYALKWHCRYIACTHNSHILILSK